MGRINYTNHINEGILFQVELVLQAPFSVTDVFSDYLDSLDAKHLSSVRYVCQVIGTLSSMHASKCVP